MFWLGKNNVSLRRSFTRPKFMFDREKKIIFFGKGLYSLCLSPISLRYFEIKPLVHYKVSNLRDSFVIKR